MYWQRFGSANADATALQNFTYTELQTGVMNTQYQGFPIPAGQTYEWTEYFTSLGAAGADARVMSADYHNTTVPFVDRWMDARGLGSVNTSRYDQVDDWLRQLADQAPAPENLLWAGEIYGGLEATRTGRASLTPGTIFPLDRPQHQETPWSELLLHGTFSNATLAQHALSFMIDPAWIDVVESSMQHHGTTWLHHFHLGVMYMEQVVEPMDAAFNTSWLHFNASFALRDSPEVRRALAIIASVQRDYTGAFGHYDKALRLVASESSADPGELRTKNVHERKKERRRKKKTKHKTKAT